MALLGIDIGTSGVKCVLFDENGNAMNSTSSEYEMYQPRPGWAEQNPSDWWNATVYCLRELTSSLTSSAGVRPGEISGIGISGQMHGLVLLDKNGAPLRDAIIWCDQRTSEQCEQMEKLIGRERLVEISGNPAMTGFTASKILWVMQNEPEIFEKTKKILLPKDYIRFMLTGEYAAEMSDASGMQLLDVPRRTWSNEILSALGIDSSLLPPVFESTVVCGYVNEAAAEITGLSKGTPVVGGAGDQAAGGVGNGIVKEGLVSVTIGTSGVVFAHTDNITIDPLGRIHTLCHAVPGCWHVMGVTQAAGLSLKWFRDNFCSTEIEASKLLETDPYVLMDKQAEKTIPGCDGLLYLPYLMGERTPHLDPNARGVFFGLSAAHTRRDMMRSVMEGVCFSLKDCTQIMKTMGISTKEVRISGGGAKSNFWRQMTADVLSRSVMKTHSAEGPALGVAILAGVGTGVFDTVQQGCDMMVHTTEQVRSDKKTGDIYERGYRRYKSLYRSLKGEFRKI